MWRKNKKGILKSYTRKRQHIHQSNTWSVESGGFLVVLKLCAYVFYLSGTTENLNQRGWMTRRLFSVRKLPRLEGSPESKVRQS